MPSVLDSALDATYAAIGLHVLVLDEVAGYFADGRKQVEAQLELARSQGRKAQEQIQKQAEGLTSKVGDALPFGLGDFSMPATDWMSFDPQSLMASFKVEDWMQPAKAQDALTSMMKKGVEMAETTWTHLAEMAPAPIDEYLTESVRFARGMFDDVVEAAAAEAKTIETVVTPPAKRAAKPATGKAPVRRSTPRKAPAKAATTEPAAG